MGLFSTLFRRPERRADPIIRLPTEVRAPAGSRAVSCVWLQTVSPDARRREPEGGGKEAWRGGRGGRTGSWNVAARRGLGQDCKRETGRQQGRRGPGASRSPKRNGFNLKHAKTTALFKTTHEKENENVLGKYVSSSLRSLFSFNFCIWSCSPRSLG